MEILSEHIENIKTLAGLFFTPSEIAIFLQVDPVEFAVECRNPYSQAYKAYESGKMMAEIKLRESIINLANAGSSPAQAMAMDLLKASNMKKVDR